jgi:hypothetical protein
MPKGDWNGHKTHWPHGHAYTGENTYARRFQARTGRWYVLRACRACDAAKTRARTAQRRAAAAAGEARCQP